MSYKRHPFADYAESRAKRVNDAQLKIQESDLDEETKQIITDLCKKEIKFLWQYFVDYKRIGLPIARLEKEEEKGK